jgi:transmembrane sensor
MNKYQKYNTEDFLSDKSFQKWVSNPAPESDLYWQTLLAQYPELNQTVHEAKLIFITIQNQKPIHPSQSQIQKIWKNINTVPLHRHITNYRWLAAASVVLLLASGVYFNRSKPTYYAQSVAQKSLIEKVNNSAKPMAVILADGSVITLDKGAKLSYPQKFKADKREVYLLGNAFFEITKNPNQPFLVYANATVTKVLGTSFWINAPENQSDVNVIVKTGKVSVYAEQEFKKLGLSPNQDAVVGVVLTPNQQVKYNPVVQTLEKSVVPQPEIVIESKAQELIFDEVPISDAFKVLEKTYGIKIVYDEETLAKCLITTSFTDEPLFDKLSILCKATGSTYEVIDGQIIINSKSCK